jgi:hypothetical protein
MSARAKVYDETTFLNVDLDISSRQDLSSLAEALHPRLITLHIGRIRSKHWARFELRRQPNNPDVAIRRLVTVIEQLPARHLACWNRATTRDFNIGIQAAEQPAHREFSVDPATAVMAGKIGARIVITVYGAAYSS